MSVPRVTDSGAEGAGNTSRGDRDGASEASEAGGPGGIPHRTGDQAGSTASERGVPGNGGGDGGVFPFLPPPGAGGAGGGEFPSLPPQGQGGSDGREFTSILPQGAGGADGRAFPSPPPQVVEGGDGAVFPPPLLDPSASGTKQFPLCLGVRMMDGTGGREPLAHTERLHMEVEIGPPRGPRTWRSYRPPYGILWKL